MDLTPEQREALRPLAAVIEGAITESPIRLGTEDWGTVLAATVLARVAAYMGGIVPAPPGATAHRTRVAEWITRGTRDLSIPEQAQASSGDEDALRFHRRESLLVLLSRLQRGRHLTEAEADTLRHHVETEIREANHARAGHQQAEELLRVAHETSNRSEAERAQAQAAIERMRRLHDRLAEETDLASPDDPITRGGAAKRIAAALDYTEQPAAGSTTEA